MAERVVVGLESVEIEDDESKWLVGGSEECLVEVGHEPPTVSQPCQRVGERLLTAPLEEHYAIPECQDRAHDDRRHRR